MIRSFVNDNRNENPPGSLRRGIIRFPAGEQWEGTIIPEEGGRRMRQTWQERSLQVAATAQAELGKGGKGPLPTADAALEEFAAEPGFRPVAVGVGNSRLQKA